MGAWSSGWTVGAVVAVSTTGAATMAGAGSGAGLPVSSTHIAVGAVFGVGFLREFLKANYSKMVAEIKEHHEGRDETEVAALLTKFRKASIAQKAEMLQQMKAHAGGPDLSKKERKGLKRV